MTRILALASLSLALAAPNPMALAAPAEVPAAAEEGEVEAAMEENAKETGGAEEIAVLTIGGMGEIKLRFYSDKAPKHVANFKKLARSGFYDGTTFHRVDPRSFMIQGGDPN